MRRTVRSYRNAAKEAAVELHGMVRRLTVGVSRSSGLWQLLGFLGLGDDGAAAERETFEDVEMFSGVGFSARPRSGQGEVVAVHIGGRSGNPVGIASASFGDQPAMADDDEAAVWNSSAIIRVKKSGDITITTKAGGKVTVDAAQVDVGQPATQFAVLGTAYRAAEAVLNANLVLALNSIAAFLQAVNTDASVNLPTATAAAGTAATIAGAAATAVGSFELAGSAYLSTSVRVK